MRIGIIGYGNMGAAIAEGIRNEYTTSVFDKNPNQTKAVAQSKIAKDARELVKDNDVVILAVKPQDFDDLLNEIKDCTKDKLVVSIAAGISTAHIEVKLHNAKVIRAMPNLAAKVKKGMTVLCKGQSAQEEDLDFARVLFNLFGETLIISESMMNAATAVSGSGPGFLSSLMQSLPEPVWNEFGNNTFAPALKEAAQLFGFSSQEASILSVATTQGTIALLKVTRLAPVTLRDQVASKGGTTEAGLKVLRGDIRQLPQAVQAAKKRAEELSKG